MGGRGHEIPHCIAVHSASISIQYIPGEYEGGYNVRENGLSQWSGYCLTPRDAYDEYDCLCANECVHPNCGSGISEDEPVAYEEEYLWTT